MPTMVLAHVSATEHPAFRPAAFFLFAFSLFPVVVVQCNGPLRPLPQRCGPDFDGGRWRCPSLLAAWSAAWRALLVILLL